MQNFKDFNQAKDQKKQTHTGSFTQDIVLEQKRQKLKMQAAKIGVSYVDLRHTTVNPDLFNLVPLRKLLEAKAVITVRHGKKIQLVSEDIASDSFKALSGSLESQGYTIVNGLCIFEDMQLVHNQIKTFQTQKMVPKIENKLDYSSNSSNIENYIKDLRSNIEKITPSTIKEGLNGIIFKAIAMRASDIHIQPQEKGSLLRFRIDGILKNVVEIPNNIYENILTQVKYDSHLKLNVRNIPQDGRMFIVVNEKKIDIRVSLIPTEFGETMVLRLLDTNKQFLNLPDLGFNKEHLENFKTISDLSQGLILVTGPTGSGKTTSLYSLLTRYNTESRKIITLEDPIEYHLENIVQSQILEKEGYTFKSALESVLRQDPDVVMVGEIREYATANTALQASLTGHVVLSTLHTNNAIETIQRLYNMGIEPFLMGPALNCIIAQRLVRKLCPSCAKEVSLNDELRQTLNKKLQIINQTKNKNYALPEKIKEPAGCDQCNGTGYKGRLVIAEMIMVDEDLSELIIQKSTNKTLLNYLKQKGFLTMEQDGILKVLAGVTSLSEIYRVTK